MALKILIPYPSGHDLKSGITQLFANLVQELSKKDDVKIYRLIVQSRKLSSLPKSDEFNEALDIHDFKNALDVLQKIKPDLVYTVPHLEFMNIAFSNAAKHLGIKTAGLVLFSLDGKLELKSNTRRNLRKTFDTNVPTDTYDSKNLVFGRMQFIFYKFWFMVKTFSAIKYSKFFILPKSFQILFRSFSKNLYVPELPLDKHFVLNEMQKETLVNMGFKENSIIVTGHPMYDHAFKKNITKEVDKNKKPINILFAPDTLYEAGIWSKNQRDNAIINIVNTIKQNSAFSLKVKIHPTSAILDGYKKIIHKIDPTVEIYQKGSLEDFFSETDLLLVYSALTTGLIYTVPYKIPVIVCNLYDDIKDLYGLIGSDLVIECKNLESLSGLIKNVIENSETLDQKRDSYVKKFLFKGDGKASKRIANEIFDLVK